MLSLGIRKLLVLSLVGGIFLFGNIWLVVNWLDDKGVIDGARYVRNEYLTGTAKNNNRQRLSFNLDQFSGSRSVRILSCLASPA